MHASPAFELPWSAVYWLAWIGAFVVAEAGVARRTRLTCDRTRRAPGDSLPGIGLLMAAGLAAVTLSAWYGLLMFRGPALYVAFALGVALMIGGSLLRRRCFALLGERFTLDVRATEGQPLVTDGPYRLVRHPSYLGGLLMLVGSGLGTGSIAGTLAAACLGMLAYGWRIRVEEAHLSRVLGDRYADFARGRKRMIPFIY